MSSGQYRLTPATEAPKADLKSTASAHGVHDTLRYGPRTLASEHNVDNAIQQRLEKWEETQDNLKLNMQRNTYGLHAPMRLLMERKIVAENPHMPAMPRTNIHLDILMGRDETLDVPDFFGDYDQTKEVDIRHDMEKKLHMK